MGPAAPRGVLRVAILHQASLGAVSGVDLIRWVEETTGGVWRPSPGSVYFLIKELESEGLLRAIKREGRHYYIVTERGRQELRRARGESAGRLQRQLAALLVEASVMNSPLQVEMRDLLRRALEGGSSRMKD